MKTTTQGRPKFRETLWFAKGQKDAEAAEEGRDDPFHPQAVDLLPVEDRYLDDGNVRPSLSAIFSVRMGTTLDIEKPRDLSEEPGVTPSELVRQLKTGRRQALAAIGTAALVLATLLALFAF